MIPKFQSRRSIFFLCCVSLTILMMFCYSYSNEFTANLVQPYIQKQLHNLDLKKLQSVVDVKKEAKEAEPEQNLLPSIGNLAQNSEVASFFKSMVGENFDFFVKLKDMQLRNVSFSEAGEDLLDEADATSKPEDQLPPAPNLADLLAKSSKVKAIESNFLFEDIETTSIPQKTPSIPSNEVTKPIQHKPSLPFLGKVSEIYPPGFLYSPSTPCASNLKLIIIVTSAPGNFKARQAIRKTWGQFNSTESFKLVFIVGSSIPKNEKKLIEEYEAHADIIHGHFVDSYYNLTLKTISMLEWIKTSCQSAKFILKADDNTFINVNKLLELMESKMNDTKTIYGRVATGWIPFRDPKSKYFITYDEFAGSVFPDFTSGPAYLMTKDCAKLIYNEALGLKYLKLEDVFITGIIAGRLNIKKVKLKEFLNEKPNIMDKCLLWESVSVHNISPREQLRLWKTFNDENKKC